MTYRKMRIALSLGFLLLFAGCAGAEDAPASDPFLAPAGIGVNAAKIRLQSRPQKTMSAAHILLEGPQ